MNARLVLFLALLVILIPAVLGHEIAFAHEEYANLGLESSLMEQALEGIFIAGLIVIVLAILAIIFKERIGEQARWLLFLGIAIPVIAATAYSAGTTIYLNRVSETRGPVHWHADFEIWVCDQLVELQAPSGISNRLGSALLHEHGDLRIHAEGVLLRREEAALGKFFRTIGGMLTKTTLVVPTKKGLATITNDDFCPNGLQGKLQVFRWQLKNNVLVQDKLVDLARYVISPENQVPPGDCIIVEFGPERLKTDRLCASYRSAISKGVLHGS